MKLKESSCDRAKPWHFWRRSIFWRIIAILLLAIVPLQLVGAVLYNAATEQMISETLSARRSQMEYYMNLIEGELTRMVSRQSTLLNGSRISTLANRYNYLPIYEWGRNVNELRDDLISLQSASGYVQSVTAYFPMLGKRLNISSGLSNMTGDDDALLAALAAQPRTIFHMLDSRLYTETSMRDKRGNVHYMLLVELSVSAFARDIAQFETGIPFCGALVLETANAPVVQSAHDGGASPDATEPGDSPSAFALSRSVLAEAGYAHPPALAQFGATVSGAAYRVAVVSTSTYGLSLYSFTRESDLNGIGLRYARLLWLFIAAAVALVLAVAISVHRMVHRPLHRLIGAFERVERGDMAVRIAHNRNDEFRDVYNSFNMMVRNLDSYIEQSLRQRVLLGQAELVQLQSQINPHFLYNSYFMLHRMIKGRDFQNAELFSKHMGSYFKYITRSAKQRLPIADEIGHARIYAEIQAMRFDGRIAVEMDELPVDESQLIVPRLIIQPILENAFEHGLRDKIERGLVRLRYEADSRYLRVVIEDNGDDLTDVSLDALRAEIKSDETGALPSGEITALKNIHRRLRAFFGETASDGAGAGLTLCRSELGGLAVRVTLPRDGGATDAGGAE